MNEFLRSPAAILSPGDGLLRNDHFQMAYVTNDIERACAIFSKRYGIREFRRLEGELPQGGHIRIELAWAGGMMFELIQTQGLGTDFYNGRLPAEGFAIRHHHLGYFVHSQSAWDDLEREISQGGWTVAWQTNAEGFMRVCYVDAWELGHYLEYIFPEPAGIAFFESVPSG
jgi:hypothetical protein